MTMTQAQASTILENQKRLEKRIAQLEDEMALCLKFMRVHAEKMAKEKDPDFKPHENPEA